MRLNIRKFRELSSKEIREMLTKEEEVTITSANIPVFAVTVLGKELEAKG